MIFKRQKKDKNFSAVRITFDAFSDNFINNEIIKEYTKLSIVRIMWRCGLRRYIPNKPSIYGSYSLVEDKTHCKYQNSFEIHYSDVINPLTFRISGNIRKNKP